MSFPVHATSVCQNRNSDPHLSDSKSHVFYCLQFPVSPPLLPTHLYLKLQLSQNDSQVSKMLCIFFFFSFVLSYFAFPPDTYPLKCMSFLSFLFSGDLSLLKSYPFCERPPFCDTTITDPLLSSSMKKATVISLCLNGRIYYGCHHICTFYYRYLCTYSRN